MSEERFKSNFKEIQCPSCGSTRLVRDHENSEVVCIDCGFVIVAKIADRGPEWRAFNNEQFEKRVRAGAPLTYTIHDMGLSTIIDWQDKDAHGKRIASDQKAQIYRLRKWQKRIRVSDGIERNLTFALSEMRKIVDVLSLPRSVFETASIIYRKAVKEHLVRGRSIQGMSAASIYIACRQHRLVRTLDEISATSTIGKKEIGRFYRLLVKELHYFVPPTKPSQYVLKLSSQLTMQGKVEEIASKILKTAKELKLISGRGPKGIAAAATYIASVLVGEKRTQREVSELAQVTEVTIRNRYKELSEDLLFVMAL